MKEPSGICPQSEWEDYMKAVWSYYTADSKGDDNIRNYASKVVRTRAPHQCMASAAMHDIPPGSFAVREKAIVDGKWAASYTCTACIDVWLAEERSADA